VIKVGVKGNARKGKGERRRYVVFRVWCPVPKRVLIGHMNRLKYRPYLVYYDGVFGIVRCTNRQKEDVIKHLSTFKYGAVKIISLKTTGTIRKAKRVLSEYYKFMPQPLDP